MPPTATGSRRGATNGAAVTGFTKVAERLVHRGAVVEFVEVDFTGPQGESLTRDVVRHPGAVAVVAVDDQQRVVLVRQFRAPLERDVFEIPAGKLDVPGEPRESTARRELVEEVGLEAERWVHLTTYATAPGFSDEMLDVYLATGLTEVGSAADGVEEQYMEVHRLPLAECLERIRDGRLADAKTIVGVLMAAERLGG